MRPMVLPLLAAAVFLSGCATWYSQTPVGVRHTRMMVYTDQEYEYYVDPVKPPAPRVAGPTPFQQIANWLNPSDR